jgi:hypothetical protein
LELVSGDDVVVLQLKTALFALFVRFMLFARASGVLSLDPLIGLDACVAIVPLTAV